MGWRDTIQIENQASTDKPSWRDTIQEDPSHSPITAATTGLIQGAVPFAGALAGAGKTAMDAITGTRGPLAGNDLGDLVDDYRQARDSFSKDARTSQEANPGVGIASNLVGGFSNPLFTGTSNTWTNIPLSKGADTLPKVIGASAIQGLGMSDADLTKGEVGKAALDTAIGAGGGALGYGIGKGITEGIPMLWDGAKSLSKKALTNLGPSAEAIEARLAGRAQDAAKSYPELAEDLARTVKGLGKETGELGDEALKTLSTENNIPKVYVTDALDQAISGLGTQGKIIGSADKNIAANLNALKSDLTGLSDNLSEREVKGLIQTLDDNINFSDKSQDKLNNILKGIRNKIDKTLKFQNQDYRKSMIPVAQRARVMNSLKKKFGLENIPGEGLQATDRTASAIQKSLGENKAITQGALKKLEEFTGKNYSELAKDYQLAQQFQKTGAQGSKRTNIGTAIGTGVGGLAGGFAGAGAGSSIGSLAGGAMDQFGGRLAGKMIDGYLKVGNSAAFGRFAPVIQKAADKGPEALSIVGSILSNNPEFRKLMGMDEEPEVDRAPAPFHRRTLSGN